LDDVSTFKALTLGGAQYDVAKGGGKSDGVYSMAQAADEQDFC
jgi:hypothetical protein